MAEKVQRIVNIINQIASPKLAEDWDNVGLLVGDYGAEVDKVMVTLDVNEAVVDEAIAQNVNLIISHHPVIFSGLKSIRADQPLGRLLIKAIQNRMNIFAAHTNLDIATGGINDLLAQRLGLEDCKPLEVTDVEELHKVVVYVPAGYVEDVFQTITKAGAGWIGNYSQCTFQTDGMGTFKPLAGSKPFIGKEGELEKVKEVRLETVVPARKLQKVIRAMVKVHPYEEVAYDIYELKNQGQQIGLGRIGYLPAGLPYQEMIQKVKEELDLPYLLYAGDLTRTIKKVAICGGSGAEYIHAAAFQGADLYITGDIKFHDSQAAESLGMALINAGHYWTEVLVVPYLSNLLNKTVEQESLDVEIIQSTVKTDPMSLYK